MRAFRWLAVTIVLGVLSPSLLTVPALAEDEKKPIPPAEVSVTGYEAEPLTADQWAGLPPELEGAQVFSKRVKLPAGSDLKGNELAFRVKKGGVILVAATWDYQGNTGGGWYESRSTHKGFLAGNWVRIARLTHIHPKRRTTFFLYRHTWAKEDKGLRFHTAKYSPPVMIIPHEKQAQAVMAMKEWTAIHPPADRPISAEVRVTPATAHVEGFSKRELGQATERWADVPDFLKTAVIHDQRLDTMPKTALARKNEVEFTAKSDGVIALAASWAFDGHPEGDWAERRLLPADLMKHGWVRFGSATQLFPKEPDRKDRHDLYFRVVFKGDHFLFHTRKKIPPYVIELKPEHIEAVRSARVKLHDVVADAESLPPLDPNFKSGASTVMLNTLETTSTDKSAIRGLLMREIPRQAVLIAARDELGLATRDRTLREAFPQAADGALPPLEMMSTVSSNREAQFTLFRRDGEKVQILWEQLDSIPAGEPIPVIVKKLGPLSRTELKQALQKAGVKPQPVKQLKTGPVPDAVAELLPQMGMFPQYEAVRRLHALIREDGESPERIAALARGYAHLGSLTESLYSPAHDAFNARALLYAERLIARVGETGWSLSHRAYVRALIGLHRIALDDMKAAQQQPADESFPLPAWAETIENFCAYNIEPLQAAAKEGDTRPLARYLIMLTLESSGLNEATAKACGAVLEDHPGCYRAMFVMESLRELGISRRVSYVGPQYLSKTLPDHLLAVPHMPEKLLDKTKQGRSQFSDLKFRGEVAGDLKQTTGQDVHEPSLAVLGQLVDELSFRQAVTRLVLEGDMLAVDADDTVAEFKPLVSSHPYGPFITIYSSDRTESQKAMIELTRRMIDVEAEWSLLRLQHKIFPGNNTYWYRNIESKTNLGLAHLDDVYGELLSRINRYYFPQTENAKMAHRLARVSPAMPSTVRSLILSDWGGQKSKLAAWERTFKDDSAVLMALADGYKNIQKDDAAAVRCLKRAISVSKERRAYLGLAEIYERQKKTDQWIETLKSVLELPSAGLMNARVRVKLAKHYLKEKDYDLAKEYAVEAAQSYAGDTLAIATRVFTAVKDYERAESYVQAAAKRYDTFRLEWLLWCRSTGHGDVQAAKELAYEHYRSAGTNVSPSELQEIGLFYLLTDEEENALELYRTAFDRGKHAHNATYAIVLADKLGNIEARDTLLKQLSGAKITTGQRGALELIGRPVRQLTALFEAALEKGEDGPLDVSAVDELLKKVPEGHSTDLMYFTGLFLEQRGQKKDAVKYLQLAAASPINRHTRTLSRHALRTRGIKIDPEREEEIKDRHKSINIRTTGSFK